jgi:uncharacterized protein YuzE
MLPIKVTYDESANAAYIYLQPGGTRVASMYACDPIEVDGMVNLDFDLAGRLVGIEVLDARAKLVPELLAAAENITRRAPEELVRRPSVPDGNVRSVASVDSRHRALHRASEVGLVESLRTWIIRRAGDRDGEDFRVRADGPLVIHPDEHGHTCRRHSPK